jgi:hypothetical protein
VANIVTVVFLVKRPFPDHQALGHEFLITRTMGRNPDSLDVIWDLPKFTFPITPFMGPVRREASEEIAMTAGLGYLKTHFNVDSQCDNCQILTRLPGLVLVHVFRATGRLVDVRDVGGAGVKWREPTEFPTERDHVEVEWDTSALLQRFVEVGAISLDDIYRLAYTQFDAEGNPRLATDLSPSLRDLGSWMKTRESCQKHLEGVLKTRLNTLNGKLIFGSTMATTGSQPLDVELIHALGLLMEWLYTVHAVVEENTNQRLFAASHQGTSALSRQDTFEWIRKNRIDEKSTLSTALALERGSASRSEGSAYDGTEVFLSFVCKHLLRPGALDSLGQQIRILQAGCAWVKSQPLDRVHKVIKDTQRVSASIHGMEFLPRVLQAAHETATYRTARPLTEVIPAVSDEDARLAFLVSLPTVRQFMPGDARSLRQVIQDWDQNREGRAGVDDLFAKAQELANEADAARRDQPSSRDADGRGPERRPFPAYRRPRGASTTLKVLDGFETNEDEGWGWGWYEDPEREPTAEEDSRNLHVVGATRDHGDTRGPRPPRPAGPGNGGTAAAPRQERRPVVGADGLRRCFNCESPDHLARDCPKPPRADRLNSICVEDIQEQGLRSDWDLPMDTINAIVGRHREPPTRGEEALDDQP